jgi:hypothetical protein
MFGKGRMFPFVWESGACAGETGLAGDVAEVQLVSTYSPTYCNQRQPSTPDGRTAQDTTSCM